MVVIFCFYHRKAFFIPQKFFFYLCIAISFAKGRKLASVGQMVCLFQAFQGRGLYLPGLIIALCGRVPLRLIGRFFRRSNGRQKVLLSPRFANRNGLNALLCRRKSCLRTSSSSLTNLQLVSNDDRYERYLHNGFVYSWRRRGSLECQVLNWMPLFVRLVFGLDFFHPFGWQISARRFRDGISRTLNVGVLHLLKEQHEFPLNLYLCLNSFHA